MHLQNWGHLQSTLAIVQAFRWRVEWFGARAVAKRSQGTLQDFVVLLFGLERMQLQRRLTVIKPQLERIPEMIASGRPPSTGAIAQFPCTKSHALQNRAGCVCIVRLPRDGVCAGQYNAHALATQERAVYMLIGNRVQ